MTYKILENRIKIIDSYTMSDEEFGRAIDEIQSLYPEHIAFKRSRKSMYLEWRAHNLLYRLGIKRSKTADVDLEYPQLWYMKIIYWILGRIRI